jgi:hypothetical protein
MDEPRLLASEKQLDRMLLTLAEHGFVTLEPPPPPPPPPGEPEAQSKGEPYRAHFAHALPALDTLLVFRSVHPLYGAFLLTQLGIADRNERLQALESVLEMPRPLLRFVRVPGPDDLPPGPLATTRLDGELVQGGLIQAQVPKSQDEDEEEDPYEEEDRPPALAEKLRLLFDATHQEVFDVTTQPVWAAGELLRYSGNFNLYVRTRDLVKQEGIVFRHLLRLILLIGEFEQVTPPDTTGEEWKRDLHDIAERLTASCREVDPASTDEAIEKAHAADVVEGEAALAASPQAAPNPGP